MKVALIVQRYGPKILAGAERHARSLAQNLAKKNIRVDVYTTTSEDYRTWRGEEKEGESYDGSHIRVLRFKPVFYRWPKFFSHISRLLIFLRWHKLWWIFQGPYCPKLVQTLKKSQNEYTKILAFTYLYYPTIWTVPFLKTSCILIPTAHDEGPFYFPKVEELLTAPEHLWANSSEERKLILKRLSTPRPVALVGAGVDLVDSALPFSSQISVEKKPYLLYLGRMTAGKGLQNLLELFSHGRPPNLSWRLHLAGPWEQDAENFLWGEFVSYLGILSEAEKVQALEEASAVINPSPHESLSLLVLEALVMGLPVLVNPSCAVLRDYALQWPAMVKTYDSSNFWKVLENLQRNPPSYEEKKAVAQMVKTVHSWRNVVHAYETVLMEG